MTSVLVKRRSVCVVLIAVHFAALGLSVAWTKAFAEELTEPVSQELKRRLSLPFRQGESFCRRAGLCGQADLDLLLTDAFLVYGSPLLSARVNPDGPSRAEKRTWPQYPAYAPLRQALADYRAIAERGGSRPSLRAPPCTETTGAPALPSCGPGSSLPAI